MDAMDKLVTQKQWVAGTSVATMGRLGPLKFSGPGSQFQRIMLKNMALFIACFQ
jgi:hypothetical protein